MELSSFSLLFRLIFAHFLADFILQSKGMANGKRGFQIIKKKKRQLSTAHKWAYHLSHSLVQAITAYLFAGMWSNWMIPLVIFVTHLIIDYIKIRYFNDRLHAFIIDQILHLLVSVFCGWVFMAYGAKWQRCRIFYSLLPNGGRY